MPVEGNVRSQPDAPGVGHRALGEPPSAQGPAQPEPRHQHGRDQSEPTTRRNRASAHQAGPGAEDDGLEREVADEMARRAPGKTWNGVPVPFGVLFPSMTKANAGASGGTGNPLTGTAYLDDLLSIQRRAFTKASSHGVASSFLRCSG